MVSSGGGAWCKVDSAVAGIAPFLCQDLHGGVAYTLDGGANAHDTAVIIAQEQAHLLGLEHVSDDNDIMYPYICQSCDGFENQAVAVTGDRCDRQTQNSYQMMRTALGAWGGGPKPSAFGCINDTAAPNVTSVAQRGPADGARFFGEGRRARRLRSRGRHHQRRAAGPVGHGQQGALQWDLTGIDGNQTITVSATDGVGHVTVSTLAVFAPSAGEVDPSAAMAGNAGCTMASGAFGAAGLIPSLAMLMLFVGRARRPRGHRRIVPGALSR